MTVTNGSSSERCVTVFLGSSKGTDPVYERVARSVGRSLARNDVTLVYGGGQSGCMGALCREALEAGGRGFLFRCTLHGIAHSDQAYTVSYLEPQDRTVLSVEKPLDSLPAVPADRASRKDRHIETQVASMHDRKRKMADLSQGFIGLPGGYGTLEEVAEMVTWTQLGIHRKPVILLNVSGFFSPLKAFVDNAIRQGFIAEQNRQFMTFVDCPAEQDASTFDWGDAALRTMADWHAQGAGGGEPYMFEWRDHHQQQISSEVA